MTDPNPIRESAEKWAQVLTRLFPSASDLSNIAIFWVKKRNKKPYSTCFKPFFLPMAALPKT